MKREYHIGIGKAYYIAMLEKRFDDMASYVHPKVNFSGPLSIMEEKQSVIEAGKEFSRLLHAIMIREALEADNKVVLVLDMLCSDPIGKFRSVSILSFAEGLIVGIELFYDRGNVDASKKRFLGKTNFIW